MPVGPSAIRRLLARWIAPAAFLGAAAGFARDESPTPVASESAPAGSPASVLVPTELDLVLADVAPDSRKWASVLLVTGPPERPSFEWFHLGDSATSVEFWPASAIKLFAVVAAMERLGELGAPLDARLTFARRPGGFGPDGWIEESPRAFRDLVSRVFEWSSNPDYNRLLRFVGVDRMNAEFLVPERGFERSAIMRGYGDHAIYDLREAQRIAVDPPGGCAVLAHFHSGRDYGEERGAIPLDGAPGNCATTRDMVECLRRVMFHERIPEAERFRLSPEQLEFLREGDGRRHAGLRLHPWQTKRHPLAWTDGVERVLPRARYYHKNGQVGSERIYLDLACVEDDESGVRMAFCAVARADDARPVARMGEALAHWALERTRAAKAGSK